MIPDAKRKVDLNDMAKKILADTQVHTDFCIVGSIDLHNADYWLAYVTIPWQSNLQQ